MSTETSVINRELTAIAAKKNGRLTPEEVVDEARDKDAPLHSFFEWDNKRGAEKYRLEQARRMIRGVTLVVTRREVTFSVPRFVRDPEKSPHEQGYVEALRLRTREELAREVVISEFERANAALGRAYAVANALGLEKTIEKLRTKLIGVAHRLSDDPDQPNA